VTDHEVVQKWWEVCRSGVWDNDLFTDYRLMRLFAVACCRSIWHLMQDTRSREAVEVAELHADGLATDGELRSAHAVACGVTAATYDYYANANANAANAAHAAAANANASAVYTVYASCAAACAAYYAAVRADPSGAATHADAAASNAAYAAAANGNAGREERERQGRVLVSFISSGWDFDRRWRTEDCVGLARQIYESNDFSATPILADALEEAGCGVAQLLAWLRSDERKYRGCRVLDELLSKRDGQHP
jgi:hypothetical protein